MKSLSLVLPVWNEGGFIADVVSDIERTLEANGIDYELLLVENGSVDQSLEVIQGLSRKNPRCRVVVRPKGYGRAVIGGLSEATKELVGYMPSDGQIEPGVLIELLKKMESGRFDLVKINRIERETRGRKFLSYCFNLMAGLLFNLWVKDINGSPKLFPRKYVPLLSLKCRANLIDTELMAKAKHLKWRIGEAKTQSLPRAGGKSHINAVAVVQFFRELVKLRFGRELRSFCDERK